MRWRVCFFRHRLERHGLGRKLFERISEDLAKQGLLLKEESILDATIIEAPPSRKNSKRERDGEMKPTKKGKQWHFGMKLHVGVDEESGLIHSIMESTSANLHDLTPSAKLLHGEEVRVRGDAGYGGIEKREEHQDRNVTWCIAMRPGKRRRLDPTEVAALLEGCKASVRAKVEHIFFYIKRMFGYAKVRYRGLGKNENRLALLLGFANLLRAESCLA